MAEPNTQGRTPVSNFDPSAECATYKDHRASWQLNRDFAEMDVQTLRAGTYLDQFGKGDDLEPAGQYDWRKSASLAMDHAADLIDLRVQNIFRVPPKRNYEDSQWRQFIDDFLANVDQGGTSINDFMRRALRGYYTNGVDIVVDRAATPEGVEIMNRAQERELGLMPYLHALGPLDRVDWACDHSGAYLWSRYNLGADAVADELGGGSKYTRYLTMTRNEWRLYYVPNSSSESESVTMESGPHGMTICPVVPFYFKESSKAAKVPLSLLTRISPIARYLLNLVSQVQLDIYRNIGFMVATGVKADSVPTQITPMGCWAFESSEAKVSPMSGDVAQIEVKLSFVDVLMQAILRIGKLHDPTGDGKGRATSGTQVAVERTDLDNEMRSTAHQCEAVETEVVRMAISRYEGREVAVDEIGYTVAYNTRYVLTGVPELIANMQAMVKTGVPAEVPELLAIQARGLLNALVNEDDDAYERALQQIKNVDTANILADGEPDGDEGFDDELAG